MGMDIGDINIELGQMVLVKTEGGGTPTLAQVTEIESEANGNVWCICECPGDGRRRRFKYPFSEFLSVSDHETSAVPSANT
jgi:hypothetical protein